MIYWSCVGVHNGCALSILPIPRNLHSNQIDDLTTMAVTTTAAESGRILGSSWSLTPPWGGGKACRKELKTTKKKN